MGVTMGFQRSTFKLVWPEGHELHGLEVRMRRLNIGRLVEAQEAADSLRGSSYTEALAAVVRVVAAGLIGWNLEEEVGDFLGESRTVPVPADESGVASADLGLVVTILRAWLDVATNIPLDSSEPSERGESSENGSADPASTGMAPGEESWAPMLEESQQPIAMPV